MKRAQNVSSNRPSTLVLRILELCIPSSIVDYLLGDLLEEFYERNKAGEKLTRLWLWKQTLFAVLHLSFRGNLASIAAVINLLFFSLVSYAFLELSGFAFHWSVQKIVLGLVFFLPFIALPIINNFGVLRDALAYSSDRAQFLDEIELTRLSRFAGFVKIYCFWVGAMFMVASATRILGSADVTGATLHFYFLLGLELMLLIHASALHSIFSLLEERGHQDAQFQAS